MKDGGDYIFLHSRLYKKTRHRISTVMTAALFLNEWTGTFLSNREPAAVPAQNNYSTEHVICFLFFVVHIHTTSRTYVWEEILLNLETEYQQNTGLFCDRLKDATKANMILRLCQFVLWRCMTKQ